MKMSLYLVMFKILSIHNINYMQLNETVKSYTKETSENKGATST
jgi:hypothetical protein